jgi:predicted nucleic acid-binding protein
MNLYADTSFIMASRVRHDTFHRAALQFYRGRETDLWFWSPWHRVEVLNTIRQLTRNPDRKRSISQTEGKALIYRIETDVRLGYFFHMEADWRDVLRTACEISAENAFARACPGTDLLHVAYAKEFAADLFVSFDDEQLMLAQAAGLKAVRPRKRRSAGPD